MSPGAVHSGRQTTPTQLNLSHRNSEDTDEPGSIGEEEWRGGGHSKRCKPQDVIREGLCQWAETKKNTGDSSCLPEHAATSQLCGHPSPHPIPPTRWFHTHTGTFSKELPRDTKKSHCRCSTLHHAKSGTRPSEDLTLLRRDHERGRVVGGGLLQGWM